MTDTIVEKIMEQERLKREQFYKDQQKSRIYQWRSDCA